MRTLLAVFLLGVLGSGLRADDKPIDRADLDKRLAVVVYNAIARGSDIYNAGNVEGCYRLYQGTLLAVLPLLDHRPKLAEAIAARLDQGSRLRPVEAAFALRESLDEVQKALTTEPPKKTLFARMGGENVARAVVHDFVVAAIADPKVNLSRGGKYQFDQKQTAYLEKVLYALLSEVTQGPPLQDTPEPIEPAKIKGLMITAAEYDAAAADLVAALRKNKVPEPEIEEIRAFFPRGKALYVQ